LTAEISASDLRKKYPYTRPAVISKGPIFGLGYRPAWRLGNVFQARFAVKHSLNVMLAQQSAREIERTGRSFQDVIDSASQAAYEAGLKIPWGADGDHLRSERELASAAHAGCTHFTFDVTSALKSGFDAVVDQVVRLFNLAREIKQNARFTTEISLDEGEQTTPLADIVKLLSVLREKKITIDEIAPRFPGCFEKAIDYYSSIKNGRRVNDTREFEDYLRQIAEAAQKHQFRVCVHSGSDKFSVYPIIAQVLGDNFHLKTAGTYYLEGLKIIARHDFPLFMEIYEFSRAQFEKDRATYEISCDLSKIPDLSKKDGKTAAHLLKAKEGSDDLRQMLHVGYGSVLTARDAGQKPRFAGKMETVLRKHAGEYETEMTSHLERHFKYFLNEKR
jgi:hypothetical protein